MLEARSLLELGAYFVSSPLFNHMAKGDGHAVLVLPGLGASNLSTMPLRSFLQNRGYQPYGWELGRNLGLRKRVFTRMLAQIDDLFEKHRGKLSIVGWSLGGIYARELAKLRAEKVRIVISLGSPHSGNLRRSSHATPFYEMVSGHSVDNLPIHTTLSEAPPVPTTSIYSKTDGIVAWESCHQDKPESDEKIDLTENIRVDSSHIGLGVHPSVLYLIADRLAQSEGHWKPFVNDSARSLFFQTPEHDFVATA